MSIEGTIVPTKPEGEKCTAEVMIAMPDGLLIQGLKMLLEARGVQVGKLCSDAKDIDKILECAPTPGILLVDTDLPNLNLVSLSKSIKGGRTKIILLGEFFHPAGLRLYQKFGVNNAVLKSDSADDLVKTILGTRNGSLYRSPRIAEAYRLANAQVETIETITLREAEVLRLIVRLYTNKQIAVILKISVKTVETHRSHILDKTGNPNLAKLTDMANCLIITAEQKPGGKREHYEYGQK
ncbi:MAG: response regulator containing a CheY-like receiver domain and an HTH DNA-binding domain [Microgenomates group bacterium Gr01-1014_5]|nr:MAG: response regulator containing a CheY-like receiver domain and an HTH DNA-binding domain [Microgenomates group bacterium Gr01-1014_5]